MSLCHRLARMRFAFLAAAIMSFGGCREPTAKPDRKAGTGEPKSVDAKYPVKAAVHGGANDSASVWKELAAGNARFVADQGRPREFVNTRRELANGQHPRAVVLTCADSRLSPELIFDCNLGELFVVRTAGNIADPIVLGSIEYAVDHLHVKTVIVLGHEKCGAVAAAASGEAMPTANLEAVVRKIEPALKSIEPQANGDELVRRGVEANVHAVVDDMLQHSPVLKEKIDHNELAIFPAIYRLQTGGVELLK